MSQAEHAEMVRTGHVVESHSGVTHVASPANPEAYRKQARPGSVYVEFDVPAGSVTPTSTNGWAKIPGPNSIEARLAKQRGQPVPQMPGAANIQQVEAKPKKQGND